MLVAYRNEARKPDIILMSPWYSWNASAIYENGNLRPPCPPLFVLLSSLSIDFPCLTSLFYHRRAVFVAPWYFLLLHWKPNGNCVSRNPVTASSNLLLCIFERSIGAAWSLSNFYVTFRDSSNTLPPSSNNRLRENGKNLLQVANSVENSNRFSSRTQLPTCIHLRVRYSILCCVHWRPEVLGHLVVS